MSRVLKSAGLALVLGLAVMGGASSASADATAEGIAAGSPGVLSGNVIQIPVHIPINLCGNSINVIGALNPAAGNVCVNA
ncbi:chaplin [Streptomyces virginiae]|uniref:chaplin n=1 Tax=Streptomyces virginiae TaxID=1961 RepID=UPI00052564E9|nr:chaplin [Streptomyces virginiae]